MRKKARLLALMAAACSMWGCQKAADERSWIYPAASASIGMEIINYDFKLGKNISTVSVHPDDGGALVGEATTNLTGGTTGGVRLEGGASLGTDYLRIKTATGLRILDSEDRYRQGMYDAAVQPIPGRDLAHSAFAYTQFRPDIASFVPSLGLEGIIPIGDKEKIGFEVDVSFPYIGFEVESGHDRYSQWEPVKRHSWRGFGFGASGKITYIEEGFSMGPSVGVERFKANFGGEPVDVRTIVVRFDAEVSF